ncbi:hypothetical protein ES705_47017 [subsurface metagenome]
MSEETETYYVENKDTCLMYINEFKLKKGVN